jgi:hypothetical protein
VYAYLAGQLGGGAWAVADNPTTNLLVSYSDLRLLVGSESFYVRSAEWNVEAGYVLLRHPTVNDDAVESSRGTALVQVSVAF